MARQYYRKSRPSDQHSIDGWVRMTGREYYQFITDPRNQDCRFVDLGDVVLESPESIYREHKAELHHSDYLREQEAEYKTVSLYCLDEETGYSGEDVIADDAEAVEEQAIRNVFKRQIREIMPLLTDEQQWLLQELYIKTPPATMRQLSKQSGIPVMTLQDRKAKILQALKQVLLSQGKEKIFEKFFRKNSKKVGNKK